MKSKIKYSVLFLVVTLWSTLSMAQTSNHWMEQYPEFVKENTNKWMLKSASNMSQLSRIIEVGIDLERKSIVGYSGCNPFQINLFSINKKRGEYELVTKRAVITENDCTENVTKNEKQLIRNLDHARLKLKLTENEMTITNHKKVVMRFDRVHENPLFSFMSRYYWKLIQFEGNSSVVYQSYFYFDFTNNKLIGDAGCGPFSVDFEISSDKDELTFSTVKYTNVGCIDEVRDLRSQAFVDKLTNQVYSFDVADQTLNFYQDNQLVLMFGFIPKGY